MKALTLHQPWATLVVLGAKRIETRSWATHYRGPLAIHASRRFTRELEAVCNKIRFSAALRPEVEMTGHAKARRVPWRSVLPFGQVVGTVELVDCRPTRALRAELNTDDDEWHFGDYTDGPGGIGRYGFILDNPKHWGISCIPARGQQGIWEWDQQPYHGCPPETAECVNP